MSTCSLCPARPLHALTPCPCLHSPADAIFTSLELDTGEHTQPELYPRPDGTIYTCGETDDEPLPAHSSLVVASDKELNTLHRHITALSPHLANAEEVVRQACYLPVSDRGRPFLGKVKGGPDGVWIGGGGTCWGITLGESLLLLSMSPRGP